MKKAGIISFCIVSFCIVYLFLGLMFSKPTINNDTIYTVFPNSTQYRPHSFETQEKAEDWAWKMFRLGVETTIVSTEGTL